MFFDGEEDEVPFEGEQMETEEQIDEQQQPADGDNDEEEISAELWQVCKKNDWAL